MRARAPASTAFSTTNLPAFSTTNYCCVPTAACLLLRAYCCVPTRAVAYACTHAQTAASAMHGDARRSAAPRLLLHYASLPAAWLARMASLGGTYSDSVMRRESSCGGGGTHPAAAMSSSVIPYLSHSTSST
jgi:hypothetical protein